MTDLVVVSLERWDEVWRRNQYLVDGLLRADPDLRVLFVEPPADPLHDLVSRRRAPSWGRRPTQIGDTGRLWGFRPVKVLPRRLDDRADERLAGAIASAARAIGLESPVLWINDPGLATVMDATGWPTLYDITDDWLVADRPRVELQRLARGEKALLERAAAVVACSPELVRRKSPQRPATRHPVVLIPNAVDVDEYQRPRPRPADLPVGPTAIYVGTIHADRFDAPLAAEAARALGKRATLVLVGPNLLSRDDTALLTAAGAAVLGPRSRREVIGYLQHADVLVTPHLVSAFTDSLDPIKLYEYLAVGRPIVSTPVAGFRDAEGVTCASGEEFTDAVLAALDPSRETSVPSTPGGDWAERAHRMAEVIGSL